MMKALAVLVLLSISADKPHRPPAQVPPVSAFSGRWRPPVPTEHTKILSVATCPWANSWTGYWIQTFGVTALGATNSIVNANPASPGPSTVTLYCDALLPADVTSFDYAELEYFAPDELGNAAPTLQAYLDVEGANINGYAYSQTVALGSCTGPLSPLYSGTNPLSTCSTGQGQTFDFAGGAFPGFWPGETWSYPSIHFLVSIPASPDAQLPNVIYRIIVHFHAL